MFGIGRGVWQLGRGLAAGGEFGGESSRSWMSARSESSRPSAVALVMRRPKTTCDGLAISMSWPISSERWSAKQTVTF